MSILSFQLGAVGTAGQSPRTNILLCTDDINVVTAAGFIAQNIGVLPTDVWNITYAYDVQTAPSGTFAIFTTAISDTGVITLSADSADGNVTLPTVTNTIAVFTNTTGTIASTTGTAGHAGPIQAGASGVAGYFDSYPTTAAMGRLRFQAADAGGNFNSVVTNAALGQGTTFTLPDPHTSNANFILSANLAGNTQHINTGHFQVDTGNISAGSSGAAGTFICYPPTASKGSLIFEAANNAGNTTTTIINASFAQASTLTIPDPSDATADIVLSPSALISGNLVEAVGPNGIIVDAGYRIFSNTTASWGGGGTTHTFTALDVTTSSIVVAKIYASANEVSITKVVEGAGSIDVTFDADPGAGTILKYILTSVAI